MIIFDKERTNELIGWVASGFGVNPVYIILFVVVLLVFVLFLLFSHRIIRRREEAQIDRTIEEKNRRAFTAAKLTDDETNLIDSLAVYLKDPRKKYLLISSASTLSACLARGRVDGIVGRTVAETLLKKLGVDPRKHVGRLRSTADIPEGLSVIVELSDRKRVSGIVEAQESGIFVVRNTSSKASSKAASEASSSAGGSERDGSRRVGKPNEKATVYCFDSRGVFAFITTVVRSGTDTLVLRHTDKMKLAQRREYFRKNISISVVVRSEGKTQTAKLLDLGGGGASLENPGLSKGDDVQVFFTRGHDDWLPIAGEVVRTSKGDRVAHIRFDYIADAVRDQIIKMVNT